MTRTVRHSARSAADLEQFVTELEAASGALPVAWYQRLTAAIGSLSFMPERCPRAPEADDLGLELRELVFGRRRGAVRILFTIEPDVVHIVHLRWGFRRPVRPEDLI